MLIGGDCFVAAHAPRSDTYGSIAPPSLRYNLAAMTNGIKALIFDFDGLILDTETPDYQVWCSIYQEQGFELPREKWVFTEDHLRWLVSGSAGASPSRRERRPPAARREPRTPG